MTTRRVKVKNPDPLKPQLPTPSQDSQSIPKLLTVTTSDHHPIPMTVGTQCEGGSRTYEYEYAIDRAFRKACYDIKLSSLDVRVQELAILLRLGGQFGEFEGDPVENIKYGRNRSYISVDYLYPGSLKKVRDIEVLGNSVVSRIESTPSVLHALCVKRKVKLDLPLMTQEFTVLKGLYLNYLHSVEHLESCRSYLTSEKRMLATGSPTHY